MKKPQSPGSTAPASTAKKLVDTARARSREEGHERGVMGNDQLGALLQTSRA